MGLRIFAAVGMCVWCTGAHAQRIAAASDVQPVLDELLRTYTNPQGTKMTVTYASSGKLAMQIEAGARFAFYVSADAFWVDRLRTRNPSALVSPLASGRLMLVAPIGSNMCADGLPGTRTFAKRFAIAHPEHAPYGNRAREVLQRQGSWDTLLMGKRIVMADSVASAAQWIVTGAAEAGLVSWTHHAQFPKSKFCVLKVPSAQHSPLHTQIMRLDADPRFDATWSWITSATVREGFEKAGLHGD